jgi:cation transport regulator ChaB
MPKPVDDLVETLLSNPDFYPDKSEKEQKAIAFAIAWKQYNKSNKKKSNKKSSNIINNVRIASNLVSYSYKLDNNGNFDIADELLRIAYSLIEK